MVGTTPLERVLDLVASALGGLTGTRWVGIDGFGAAGKTTLAARVVERLPGAVSIGVDDFAAPGLPGWDRERFREQVLRPLSAARPGRYQLADVLTGQLGRWVDVPVGVAVVVEGVSATDIRVGVPWDLTIWVDVPEEERRRRILARDPPELLARWRTDWWPSEEAYAREQRPWERADAVVREVDPVS